MIVFPVLVSFTPWPTSLYDVIVDVADGHVNVSDRAVELTALHPPGICGAENSNWVLCTSIVLVVGFCQKELQLCSHVQPANNTWVSHISGRADPAALSGAAHPSSSCPLHYFVFFSPFSLSPFHSLILVFPPRRKAAPNPASSLISAAHSGGPDQSPSCKNILVYYEPRKGNWWK